VDPPDEPLMPPLRPMVARAAPALPDRKEAARLAFEPKFDGFLN
jgi:ATP-dependent DNA ligase